MYENDYDIDNLTHDELLAEIGLDALHDPQAARRDAPPRGGRRRGVL